MRYSKAINDSTNPSDQGRIKANILAFISMIDAWVDGITKPRKAWHLQT